MIRKATPADIERITAIYNETILEGGFTGDLDPLSIENRQAWFLDHQERYAVFVKDLDSVVVGYAALSPYRKGRKAFRETCELSYYLSRQCRGSGLGGELIDYAMEQARKSGFRLIVAIILECNRRSVDLLLKRGFSISGRLPSAAKIDGKYCDHLYLSRSIIS